MESLPTPYIIFALTQLVAFVVWIISLQTKITKMEEQIKTLKTEVKESKTHSDWIREKLNEVNQALAVAKSVMEQLVLKEMKTKRA